MYAGQSALYSIDLIRQRDPGEFKKSSTIHAGMVGSEIVAYIFQSSIYAGDDEAMNFCCNTFDALQFNVDLVKGFIEYSDFCLVWVVYLHTLARVIALNCLKILCKSCPLEA